MTRSTSRAIAASAIAIFVSACTGTPLEERPPSEIRSLLDKPAPRCADSTGTLSTQPTPECVQEQAKYYDRVHEALAAAHAADIAAAPACLRSVSVPAEYFALTGVDPSTPNAVAEMITRGYVVSGVLRLPQCAAEVCQWRARREPRQVSGYCDVSTIRTPTKGSPDASRELQASSSDGESKESPPRAR